MAASNEQQHHSAPKDGGATAIMVPTKKTDDSLNAETEIDLRQMDENDVKSLQQSGKCRLTVIAIEPLDVGQDMRI
jgi:hypothetical protein